MEKSVFRYHTDGMLPEQGEVWVFGSNTAGFHGAGSALIAKEVFNAAQFIGEGLTGHAYGIPTKGYDSSRPRKERLYSLDLKSIELNIQRFCAFTRTNPQLQFWVTGVACGYAGYPAAQIAPLFKNAINCSFPLEWMDYLSI